MLKLKQKYSTGFEIVHFVSAWEADRGLCGQDLAGDDSYRDERGSYEQAEKTTDKVDCKECITIVEHCKSIKRKEWIKNKN